MITNLKYIIILKEADSYIEHCTPSIVWRGVFTVWSRARTGLPEAEELEHRVTGGATELVHVI